MSIGKRVFDLLLALALLPLLLPMMGIVALVVLLLEGRPVLYVSPRQKCPDRTFRLIKFRTMSHDPDDHGVSGGHKQSRITPLGRFLRRTRLDELPQIFNILRGDMSFVGPRPPDPHYVARFPGIYARVLQSRPGVTGLASLRYHAHEERILRACRNAHETDDAYTRRCIPAKARLDLIYQKNRSLCFDLRLIAETALLLIPSRMKRWRGR